MRTPTYTLKQLARAPGVIRATLIENERRIADLEAENARLQARVEELETAIDTIEVILLKLKKAVEDERRERDGYKALAERLSDFIEDHYKDGVCLICGTNTTQSHDGCWVGGLEVLAANELTNR